MDDVKQAMKTLGELRGEIDNSNVDEILREAEIRIKETEHPEHESPVGPRVDRFEP